MLLLQLLQHVVRELLANQVRQVVEDHLFELGTIRECGEGAGYAGGIMTAALDGARCAEAAVQSR